ncbi:SYT13 protein, partial [Atractosteus spatula]|nr:SYT13 protein [Atractosteus spatula]
LKFVEKTKEADYLDIRPEGSSYNFEKQDTSHLDIPCACFPIMHYGRSAPQASSTHHQKTTREASRGRRRGLALAGPLLHRPGPLTFFTKSEGPGQGRSPRISWAATRKECFSWDAAFVSMIFSTPIIALGATLGTASGILAVCGLSLLCKSYRKGLSEQDTETDPEKTKPSVLHSAQQFIVKKSTEPIQPRTLLKFPKIYKPKPVVTSPEVINYPDYTLETAAESTSENTAEPGRGNLATEGSEEVFIIPRQGRPRRFQANAKRRARKSMPGERGVSPPVCVSGGARNAPGNERLRQVAVWHGGVRRSQSPTSGAGVSPGEPNPLEPSFVDSIDGIPSSEEAKGEMKTSSSMLNPKLHFSLTYHTQKKELQVTVIEAEHVSVEAGTDGYIVGLMTTKTGRKEAQTSIRRLTPHVLWEEPLGFPLPEGYEVEGEIALSLYSCDRFSRQANLGVVRFKLADVGMLSDADCWVDLQRPKQLISPASGMHIFITGPSSRLEEVKAERLSCVKAWLIIRPEILYELLAVNETQLHIITLFLQELSASVGEILLSISYLPAANRLGVVVMKARGLQSDKLKDVIDISVKLALKHQSTKLKKKQTRRVKHKMNPVWNEMMMFEVPHELLSKSCLDLEVLNQAGAGAAEQQSLGQCFLGLQASGTGLQHWQQMLNNPRKQIAMWHPLYG